MFYTVIDAQGEPIAQGLTLAEAGRAILTHDGAQYELRPDADGEGWILWGKSLNGPWTAYVFGSWQADRDAADLWRGRQLLVGSCAFIYSVWALYGTGEQAVFWGFLVMMVGIPFYTWRQWRNRLQSVTASD